MTDDKIALSKLLEKSCNASFLREMIGFAAEYLMALAAEALCNAALGEPSAYQGDMSRAICAPCQHQGKSNAEAQTRATHGSAPGWPGNGLGRFRSYQ